MVEQGKYIFEFQKKVEICCEILQKSGVLKKGTKNTLAEEMRTDVEALRSAYQRSRISKDLEIKLSQLCGFQIHDLTWCDSNIDDTKKAECENRTAKRSTYSGKDTAFNFKQMMEKLWAPLRLKGTTSPDTDINFALINVTDRGGANNRTQIEATVQIDIKGAYCEGCSYGFSVIYIYFVRSCGSSFCFHEPMGLGTPFPVKDLLIEAGGTLEIPSWRLTSTDGVIKGTYWPKDPIVTLLHPSEVDRFDAELRVQLGDGSLTLSGDSDVVSANKKAILNRLMSKKIDGNRLTDGWIAIAKQDVRIIGRVSDERL